MKIVAIGGGEKEPAVKEALGMSDKDSSVLVIPSACSTERSYNTKVPRTVDFFHQLGVSTRVLHGFNQTPTKTQLEELIGTSSLAYTIGGSFPFLKATFSAHGTSEILTPAVASDKLVHMGTSAGALIFFNTAHSCPVPKPAEVDWDYAYIEALGLIPGVATAHADQHDPSLKGLREKPRYEELLETFPSTESIGYGIDNDASLIVNGTNLTVVRANPAANVRIATRDQAGAISSTVLE